MAWLRGTCVVLAAGTAAAAVAGVVAVAVAVVGAAFCAAVITPCPAEGWPTTSIRGSAFIDIVAIVVAVCTCVTSLTVTIGTARCICPSSVRSFVGVGATVRKSVIAGRVAFASAAAAMFTAAGSAVPITALVAVTYAQLPPPDAAASTAAAPVTRHGRVARDLKPAGEGEQHEVSEQVQGLFRPLGTHADAHGAALVDAAARARAPVVEESTSKFGNSCHTQSRPRPTPRRACLAVMSKSHAHTAQPPTAPGPSHHVSRAVAWSRLELTPHVERM